MVLNNIFMLVNFCVHTPDIFWNIFHWPGTVERNGGDDMIKKTRSHLHHQAAHPRPFHLENAGHFTAPQHIEQGVWRFGGVWSHMPLVIGDIVHGVNDAVALFNEPRRPAHDGEGA